MNAILIAIAFVFVLVIAAAIVIVKNNKTDAKNAKVFANFEINEYFTAKQQMDMVMPRTYQNTNHVCMTWQDWNSKQWFVFIRMNQSGRTFQYSSDNFDGHVATIAWATSQASKGLLAQ